MRLRERMFWNIVIGRHLFAALFVGAIAGFLVGLLFKPKHGAGLDIFLGILGALLGSMWLFISPNQGEFVPSIALMVQFMGSIILISIGRFIESK